MCLSLVGCQDSTKDVIGYWKSEKIRPLSGYHDLYAFEKNKVFFGNKADAKRDVTFKEIDKKIIVKEVGAPEPYVFCTITPVEKDKIHIYHTGFVGADFVRITQEEFKKIIADASKPKKYKGWKPF